MSTSLILTHIEPGTSREDVITLPHLYQTPGTQQEPSICGVLAPSRVGPRRYREPQMDAPTA